VAGGNFVDEKKLEALLAGLNGNLRVVEETDELLRRIEQRSIMYVIDNIDDPTPSDFIFVKNAMLIGATIKGEVQMEFDQREIGEK
jgi:hypothetical protein